MRENSATVHLIFWAKYTYDPSPRCRLRARRACPYHRRRARVSSWSALASRRCSPQCRVPHRPARFPSPGRRGPSYLRCPSQRIKIGVRAVSHAYVVSMKNRRSRCRVERAGMQFAKGIRHARFENCDSGHRHGRLHVADG
jgi:hypothetical protein